MTRNREIDLEDLVGCDHEPEIPVTADSGRIVYWVCRCGRKHPANRRVEEGASETGRDDD